MSILEKQINFSGKKLKSIVIVGIIIVSIIIVGSHSIAIIPAGHRGVLLEWSAVTGVEMKGTEIISTRPPLQEGLNFIIPFQNEVLPIEVRTLKVEATATGASKDLQDVSSIIAVNVHINPEAVHVLWKQVGGDYQNRVIAPAIQETVKQTTALFNAEELVTKRETVKLQIENSLREKLNVYNLVTEQILITDFQFSPLFTQSIEEKVVAEQSAQKAKNILIQIQVEAEQAQAKAVGEANANIAKANGEAQAINTINEALANNPNYLEWLKTQKWNGELPRVTGGAIPFVEIPMEGNP